MKFALYLHVQCDTVLLIIGLQFYQSNSADFIKMSVWHVEFKKREADYGFKAINWNVGMTQTHN